MVKLNKRIKAATAVADLTAEYPLQEAIEVLYKFPKAKFDETVEVSMCLDVDPRQGDQMVRGTVALPNGSGKKVRVLAFTEDPKGATDAGAEFAGLDDYMEKIQEGWMDFDVAVATPEAMKKVRSIARVLGPKGLMPNPKSGTVSDDIAGAIKAVKAGRVEFKMDKAANIGVGIGKRSFEKNQIAENFSALLDAVAKAKPEAIKGRYIKNVVITATMSPGVRLASSEYAKL
jgi:large subunit ribosomal protein L1